MCSQGKTGDLITIVVGEGREGIIAGTRVHQLGMKKDERVGSGEKGGGFHYPVEDGMLGKAKLRH